MPVFRSQGNDSLLYYLQRSIRYPAEALIDHAQGRVFVSFVVNKDGRIADAKVAKALHPALDKEALRAVKSLPTWKAPGRQHGQPVNVALTIPVVFQIRDATPQELQATAGTMPAAPAAGAAYQGPRFPGGPDSLRALLARSTRQELSGPVGRLVLQFELQNDQHPQSFKLISPPRPVDPKLVKAGEKALDYLKARMPDWQAGTIKAKDAGKPRKMLLALEFGATPGALPYAYADQHPVFPDLVALLLAQYRGRFKGLLDDTARVARLREPVRGLESYAQHAVGYPPEALRNGQEGVVYAYYEVAESGAIEHGQIIGSTAGASLEAETLRVIRNLPAATVPARLGNRPARVFYVLPMTFKIQ